MRLEDVVSKTLVRFVGHSFETRTRSHNDVRGSISGSVFRKVSTTSGLAARGRIIPLHQMQISPSEVSDIAQWRLQTVEEVELHESQYAITEVAF